MLQKDISKREKEVEEGREKRMKEGRTRRKSRKTEAGEEEKERGGGRNGQRTEVKKRGMGKSKGGRKERR